MKNKVNIPVIVFNSPKENNNIKEIKELFMQPGNSGER